MTLNEATPTRVATACVVLNIQQRIIFWSILRCGRKKVHVRCLISWWVLVCTTLHKIGQFGDVLTSQSLGLVLKKLTKQKQATQKQNGKTCESKPNLNLLMCVCISQCTTVNNTAQYSSDNLPSYLSLLRWCLLEKRGYWGRVVTCLWRLAERHTVTVT